MKYTNNRKLPTAMAVMLATDTYAHSDNPKVISVTTLLGSIRSLVLQSRMAPDECETDIFNLISSKLGTAVHDSLEQAWLTPHKALLDLGFSKGMVDRVNVNPPEPTDGLDVYVEKRTEREILGWIVSGQFDLTLFGEVQDLKNTKVYTYINGTTKDAQIKQLSIYRWLNPTIITKDVGKIIYNFKDWTSYLVKGNYPAQPILEVPIPLMSLEETESFIRAKLIELDRYAQVPSHELPQCTPEELWQSEPTYKYYSKPDAKKASKVFDSLYEANQHMYSKGVGHVKEFQGEPTKCKYCSARPKCDQATRYIQQGLLKLE